MKEYAYFIKKKNFKETGQEVYGEKQQGKFGKIGLQQGSQQFQAI